MWNSDRVGGCCASVSTESLKMVSNDSMRVSFAARLVICVWIAAFAAGGASACGCASLSYLKSPRDAAKADVDWASAIFEGTPERFEIEWNVLNAKEGEWVSTFSADPTMVVTFRVTRKYKGDIGEEVEIRTGFGGGDCARVFETGVTYVVFAGKAANGAWSDSLCSPTRWIGALSVAPALRLLRKEPATPSDRNAARRPDSRTPKEIEASEKREAADERKRYDAVSGKICGRVSGAPVGSNSVGRVSFLSAAGFYPNEYPSASVGDHGTFCSPQLGPGKYFLYFTSVDDDALRSAEYYPGVTTRDKAVAIEVGAGQTVTDANFTAPPQRTYRVLGVVTTSDDVEDHAVRVSLVPLDGLYSRYRYSQPVNVGAALVTPSAKFVDFDNILPGRYVAVVSDPLRCWETKKKVIEMTAASKTINIEAHLQR